MTSRGQEFLERLSEQILVGDGGFGTRLYERGFGFETSFEQLNLTRPDVVEEIFREYVSAGADVLETNSFCVHRHKQRRFGLEDRVADMAREAARISRRAAGPERFVAGSLGAIARFPHELDEYSEDEIRKMYREPFAALLEGGADLLMLETFAHLSELKLALEVAREFDVPVVCQMAFGEEGTTSLGVTAERAARILTAGGAHVIGANCRSGPQILHSVVERQSRVTDRFLSVYPNAGYAQQVEGRYIFQSSAGYFAEKAPEMVSAGATLIGGCCGTTPDHIRAVRQAVSALRPAARSRVSVSAHPEPEPATTRKAGEGFLSLFEKLPRFVTVEIEPPRSLDFREALEGARSVVRTGCDALNIPDNPLAAVRMDNVIFANLLKEHIDLPFILHLTCRDKNVIALQSNLLGAQMVGIEAVLAVTGDPASTGDQAGATSVYDVTSIGLVDLITKFNQGISSTGGALEKPTDFAIGVALNANVTGPKGLEGALKKLERKIAAGARFVETQPMFDPAAIAALTHAAKSVGIPICVGIMPIVSRKNAEFLHNEVPGLRIPKEVRDRFEGLEKGMGEKEGLRLAKEWIDAALAGGARHFYLVPPLRRYDLAGELVTYIKRT